MRDAFRRAACIGQVAAGVFLTLLVFNFPAYLGDAPLRPTGCLTGSPERVSSKTSPSVSRRPRRSIGMVPSALLDRALCVLVGLSGLREAAGIWKAMTQATCRCPLPVLGLSGGRRCDRHDASSNAQTGNQLACPDVAVIGLSEYLLVEPLPPQPDAEIGAAWRTAWRHRDLRQLAKAGRDSMWFITRRADVSGGV